jgi:hypothetical protein
MISRARLLCAIADYLPKMVGGYLALMGMTSVPSNIRGGILRLPVLSSTPVTEFTV